MSAKNIITVSLGFYLANFPALSRAQQEPYGQTESTSTTEEISGYSRYDEKEAKRWGLSKTDWIKYKEIMNNTDAGFLFKDVDPITILGSYAETIEERTKYAALYVDREIERRQGARAFDNAVNEEIARRQPSLNLFKTTNQRLQTKLPESLQNQPTLKLIKTTLFVDAMHCENTCDKFVSDLVHSSGSFSILDIYFLNTNSNDSVVRNLASKWGITRDQIVNYHVTINHDNGQYRLASSRGYQRPLPFAIRESSYGTTTITANDVN